MDFNFPMQTEQAFINYCKYMFPKLNDKNKLLPYKIMSNRILIAPNVLEL